jgi:mono/diheme cytochrome c family protein
MALFRTVVSAGIGLAFVTAGLSCARSQDLDPDLEKARAEFLQNCATCHGADGKGAEPAAAKLKTKPPDLTLLAKRNHGLFDADRVYQMIDGRNPRAAHRGSDMPVWGCRHANPPAPTVPAVAKHKRKLPKRLISQMKPHESELDSLLDLPCGSEAEVHERIISLVDYLKSVQAK